MAVVVDEDDGGEDFEAEGKDDGSKDEDGGERMVRHLRMRVMRRRLCGWERRWATGRERREKKASQ